MLFFIIESFLLPGCFFVVGNTSLFLLRLVWGWYKKLRVVSCRPTATLAFALLFEEFWLVSYVIY